MATIPGLTWKGKHITLGVQFSIVDVFSQHFSPYFSFFYYVLDQEAVTIENYEKMKNKEKNGGKILLQKYGRSEI
jgi:hypothetical protein